MTTSTYVFADDDLHISREITVTAESEKAAHAASWALLTDEEKDACGCWSCVDTLPAAVTIDVTPTWERISMLLAEVSVNGDTTKARSAARIELFRMARIADYSNTLLAAAGASLALLQNPDADGQDASRVESLLQAAIDKATTI